LKKSLCNILNNGIGHINAGVSRKDYSVSEIKQKSCNQWSRIFSYYKPHKKIIALAFLGLCLFSLVDAGMIYFVKPLIDDGLNNTNGKVLQLGAVLVIAIFFVRGAASFVSSYATAYASTKITYTIRQQAFTKLLHLPMSFFDEHSKGSLISKLTYDTDQIAIAISKAAIVTIRESLIIFVLLTMMLYNSWQLTAVFLIIGPIIAFIISKVSKRFKRISTKLQGTMGDVTKTAEQAILGHQEILLLNTATQVSEQFARINKHNQQQTMKLAATTAQSNPITQLIASFAIAAVLLLTSIEQVLVDLTPGTFTLILIAMGSLLKPLKKLTDVNQQLQKGLAASSSIFTLLDELDECDEGKLVLKGDKHDISFDNLSFAYVNANKPTINSFSVTIPAGKTTAIVGESGSGKSTISHLLLRLHQAPKNSIFINDIAIEKLNLTSLRSKFSFVSQAIVLIDDTLANNIKFGCPNKVTLKEIELAACAANVMSFANKLEFGLDTPIGENGRRLSDGQRQRIAIARAILRDSEIIVLDEATSALDNESEKKVQEAFAVLSKNRTMIVIAHRLSTIANADKILVMSEGKLIEQGSHEELMINKGYYQKLQQFN
jgi:subfamily B ATP-binding cassette protein MsbA